VDSAVVHRAEGAYEMTYAKGERRLEDQDAGLSLGFGAPYSTGWAPPAASARNAGTGHRAARRCEYERDHGGRGE
jgi:hypothetical protein